MHRGHVDMLDEIFVARRTPLGAYAAAVLRAVFGQRRTLDIAHVRDGDDHLVVGIEIFGIELLRSVDDLRAAFVAVLLLHLEQFVLDDLHLKRLALEHLIEVGDLLLQLVAFGRQFAVLQTGQRAQTHLDDRRSLQIAQAELLDQGRLGLVGRPSGADGVDHLVDIVLRDQKTQHDMQPLLGFLQVEARAAHHHVVPVLDEVADHVAQIEQIGTAVHQRDVVHGERRLQRRILIERIEHHARHGILLEDDDDAQTLTVRLVVDVGDALDLLVVDHVGDLLDHLGLVDHIGNLRHHDALAARRRMFDLGLGAHHDAAAARHKRLADAFVAVDDASGREVGAFDVFEQLLALDVAVVDIGAAGVDHLAQIVGCHVGSHTHGDTARAVDEQQRNLRGEYRRLLHRIVEVVRPVDGLLVDIGHHLVGDLAHTRLGISHRGRRVAVHRTEVALTENQRIPQRPLLRHAHHRVVDRRVTVGVELTEHVAHDTGRLTCRFIGVEAQLGAHVIQNTAVHGLQTVARIRQSTRYDDRHRVIDVGRFHLLLDIDGDDTPL